MKRFNQVRTEKRARLFCGALILLTLPLLLLSCAKPEKSSVSAPVPDKAVIVGAFIGSSAEEFQLVHLMSNNDINIGLEGSKVYDLYVPASKEARARELLETNDLVMRKKVLLSLPVHK